MSETENSGEGGALPDIEAAKRAFEARHQGPVNRKQRRAMLQAGPSRNAKRTAGRPKQVVNKMAEVQTPFGAVTVPTRGTKEISHRLKVATKPNTDGIYFTEDTKEEQDGQ